MISFINTEGGEFPVWRDDLETSLLYKARKSFFLVHNEIYHGRIVSTKWSKK